MISDLEDEGIATQQTMIRITEAGNIKNLELRIMSYEFQFITQHS